MSEISSLYSAYKVHIIWALVLILVVGIVHFWPTLKTWPAKVAAWFKKEEKQAVAVEELITQAVEARARQIGEQAAAYISTFEVRVKALEAKVEAQAQADEAKVKAAAAALEVPAPATPPTPAPAAPVLETPNPVHAWQPPVVAKG